MWTIKIYRTACVSLTSTCEYLLVADDQKGAIMGPEAILFVILNGDSKMTASVEFKDLKSCQIAEKKVNEFFSGSWYSKAFCFANGMNMKVEAAPPKSTK